MMDERIFCRTCPLCSQALARNTCPECGLWWPSSDVEDPTGAREEGRTASIRIKLCSTVPFAWPITLLAFMSLGYGAAAAGTWSFVHSPSSPLAWISVLVGLLLGGLVGSYCLAALAQLVLHAMVPATLEGNDAGLRMRVWHTWHNLLDGFRRTDVLVPRDQISGVGFMTGQGGETLLFLVHSSGRPFGTGWSGDKETAERLGGQLVDWLRSGVQQRPD